MYQNQHPRIKPIERPAGLGLKILFLLIKRSAGKVITPAKVIYSRYPKLLFVAKKLYDVQKNMNELSDELKLMIQYYVASLNGCDFCIDMNMQKAQDKKFMRQKFTSILNFENQPYYSLQEKAALRYAYRVTRNVQVSDEEFEELRSHWNEKAIIEITYLVAAENYLNRMTKPLGICSDGFCAINGA